jgi:hypothetical protein
MRDSSPFERVDFLNERQAMTRIFSDIDDIGGAPRLIENRFRLNGAAAIFTRGRTRIAAGRRIARAGATGNAYEYQSLLNCGWPPLGP